MKRTTSAYTLWSAGAETSEFIVKVLDADTARPAWPAGDGERTIVGAALPPPPDAAGDYPRHGPKTNMALFLSDSDGSDGDVRPLKGSDEPAPPQSLEAQGPVRNAERDESPPAGPQFLPRPPQPRPTQHMQNKQSMQHEHHAPLVPYTAVHLAKKVEANEAQWASETPMFMDRQGSTEWTTMGRPTRTTFSHITPDHRSVPPFYARRTELKPLHRSTTTLIFLPSHPHSTECSRTCNARRFNIEQHTDHYHAAVGTSTARFITDRPDRADSGIDFMNKLDTTDDDASATTPTYHLLYDEEYDIDKEKEPAAQPTDVTPDSQASDYDTEFMNEAAKLEEEIESHREAHSDQLPKYTFRADEADRPPDRAPRSCNLTVLTPITYRMPPTLPEIIAEMKKWAENSPIARWVDITAGNYTIMENPIYMMVVDDPSTGQSLSAKQTVLMVAGIQGRDHQAVTSTMYFLHQLIDKSSSQKELLKHFRFWVIPVFNPDGYDYSRSFPNKREWRKNLRQRWELCERPACRSCAERGLRCFVKPCYGVHLDRNFEYQWLSDTELRSQDPCGDLYAGPRQLSEPETLAFTHYLHRLLAPIHAFIAIKEGDVLGIMYPYSHTKKKRSNDNIFRQRASRAAAAASAVHDRRYVAGQTSEFLGLYAGGIEDWVDGHMGVDNAFTVMMYRPDDERAPTDSQPIVREVMAAVESLLARPAAGTLRLSAPPPEPPRRPRALASARAALAAPSRLLLLLLVMLVFR